MISAQLNGSHVILREHWLVGVGGVMLNNKLGVYGSEGLQMMDVATKYDRRKNMQGYKLMISTIRVNPLFTVWLYLFLVSRVSIAVEDFK